MENKPESFFKEFLSKFFKHKLAVMGFVILTLIILAVLLIPIILQLNPIKSDLSAFGAKPNSIHILGTDSIGRDIFARFLYGGRVSLMVGLFSALIGMLTGVPLGLAAGYYRGWIETIIMRAADIFMSFPSMIFILVLVAIVGPSVWSVTLVIGLLGWTQFARLIYANVLSIREKEYVESARAIGTSDFSIIFRYILPNSFAPILVAATFMTASAIILESSLSFLGMGVQPPAASWGNMLYDARSITVLSTKLWQWVPPGLALVVAVLSINFVGDGIRDALDPKLKI
ncbi:MAG: oligopeptide ABC transporter permease [Flexilinea sp.]